jgi:uroporphyrin-3 C-methyltransferase
MMPENDNSPLPGATPPLNPPSSPRSRRNGSSIWLAVALAAVAFGGWQWWESKQRLAGMEQELERRLAEASVASQEERGAQKALREQVEGLQGKLGAIDQRMGGFEAQASALQLLAQEMTRGREESALIEVEQAITLAVQELQVAGSVTSAMLALQLAESRLAPFDHPQYLPLRKALKADLDRLAALPVVDVPGLSLRLERVLAGVDKLPLVAYGRPADKAEKAQPEAALPWWRQTGREIWQELKGLVRIQRFDHDEPVLLAPGQELFLRENLKLRLLNARLALLMRDQATFRGELGAAGDYLARYFAQDDKAVQAARSELKQMGAIVLAADLPSLKDSQGALRNLRDGKGKK